MKQFVFFLMMIFSCSCNLDKDHEGGFFLELLFDYKKQLYNYNEIHDNEKQVVWLEEFNNNDSKFPFDLSINQNNVIASINKGMLTLDYCGPRRYLEPIPIIINEQKNYEIEVMLFIQNDTKNKNFIEFSSSGNPVIWSYGIDKIYIDDHKIMYKHPTGQYYSWGTKYNEDSFNLITSRKSNDDIAFFINRTLFAIMESKKFSCNKTYIVFNQGVNMIDYIKVSYIPE